MLALQKAQRGRILALLIISNMFLLFYSFSNRSKLETVSVQVDRLIRKLGAPGFGDEDEFEKKTKPIMTVIPAYNEAENLDELLPRMPNRINGMEVGVLVVDDGSEDNTAGIVRRHGYLSVSNLINRGGGAALRLAYDVLRKAQVEICVTMDADGQHLPQEIERLVLPISKGQYDFVIGSRVLGERQNDSFLRFVGVNLFGRIISLLIGKKITDPSSGFRAFRMDAMAGIRLYEDQYHTSELIIEAVKRGLRLGEVPITVLRRRYGKSKKGADWKYGFRFAKIVVKTWWR
jgi:glycosyltransferase involved in cell wall biosynthesis